MADSKITTLTALTAADPINDMFPVVDVSDTSMAASGTTKKISVNNILSSSPTASGALTVTGLVTAGSATITGDLTVDTSTLKVDSANDRVGVGTAIPGAKLTVAGASEALRLCNAAPYLTFYNAAQSSRFGYIQHNGTNLGIVNEIAGSLELYTNNTLQATLNSTGLGVGGSPVNFPNYTTIHAIGKTTTTGGVFQTSTSNNSTAARFACSSAGVDLFVETNHPLAFYTNAIERMRIDAVGNVGIGVTPSAWFSSWKAVQVGGSGCLASRTDNFAVIVGQNWFINNAGNNAYIGSNFATQYRQEAGVHGWFTAPSGTAGNAITFTQAMTLDANGVLLVGTTAAPNVGAATTSSGFSINGSGNSAYIASKIENGTCGYFRRDGTDGAALNFYKANSAVGNISVTASACTFNSTSDYRLKESVQPLTGGLARVSALKPSIYKWKADGSNGEGFIAHELAEVVPAAVSGEKDAVNEDGSIKPQGVDMSRVVPILVAAIQELTARVQTLEAK